MILIHEPHLLDDIADGTSSRTVTIILFSAGYFIYDLVFCIWKMWGEPRTLEYILHHLAVLFAYFVVVNFQILQPVALLGLLQGNNIPTLVAERRSIQLGKFQRLNPSSSIPD